MNAKFDVFLFLIWNEFILDVFDTLCLKLDTLDVCIVNWLG